MTVQISYVKLQCCIKIGKSEQIISFWNSMGDRFIYVELCVVYTKM